MHEPHFWTVTDRRARDSAPFLRLLATPAALLWSWQTQRRIERAAPFDPGIPVVCIGNLTLGGAGKTPVSAAVRKRIADKGLRAATLSRGYGGRFAGPLRIDAQTHAAADVGDEPLMLATDGEAWIARDRIAGAQAMRTEGVQAIVMDDGHQNPTLHKTLSIVVIDAGLPFGNGFICPKGPLREPVARGLARADAVVLMGDGPVPLELSGWSRPILRARLAPSVDLAPGRYVAFAGIGRPMRFFDSLGSWPGLELCEGVPYPDHHPYSASDETFLRELAERHKARLLTTDKDFVRLSDALKPHVARASVQATFEDVAALDAALRPVLETSS